MYKQVFKEKLKNNKILIVLICLSVILSLVGIYYNTFRENKQTFHFTTKNGPNKDYLLFFQRVSDQPEEKNVITESFYFKYGTVVNMSQNTAYYIFNSPYNEVDEIYEYNFESKEGKVIYNNPEKKEFNDILLNDNQLFILEKNSMSVFNLITKNIERFQDNIFENVKPIPNEFVNFIDDKIIMTFDECKFIKDKCKDLNEPKYYIYDTATQKIEPKNIKDVDKKYLEDSKFFGTNKVYRRGIIRKYEKDEGNLNYSIRIFTQF
jgi:hypothetical protein